MFSVCSRQPEVLWAQRSDKIYLTVSLPDARNVSVVSEPQGAFQYSAVEQFDPPEVGFFGLAAVSASFLFPNPNYGSRVL